jgi:hypothetical protein
MNEPNAGVAAEPGDPMRRRRVDLQVGQCVAGFRPLLHQADAIDHRLRLESIEHRRKRSGRTYVDAAKRIGFLKQRTWAIAFDRVVECRADIVAGL